MDGWVLDWALGWMAEPRGIFTSFHDTASTVHRSMNGQGEMCLPAVLRFCSGLNLPDCSVREYIFDQALPSEKPLLLRVLINMIYLFLYHDIIRDTVFISKVPIRLPIRI